MFETERGGPLSVWPTLPMPDLCRILAADCLHMIAGHVQDVCGVHFPGLVRLDLA